MKTLVEKYKLKLQDISFEEAKKFNCVQLKYDGFWSMLRFTKGQMEVISSGGEVRQSRPIEYDGDECIFIAEWMYGTTWGIDFKEKTGFEFVVYDAVVLCGQDIADQPYFARLSLLNLAMLLFDINWFVADTYSINELQFLWDKYPNFEGVVLKYNLGAYGSPVGRIKRDFTMDYVFMGVNPGGGKYEGKAGSIIGGLYVNGELKPVCSVGGLTDAQRTEFMSDDYIGKVFEAKGKAVFASGALRHPSFYRFRDDKVGAECSFQI